MQYPPIIDRLEKTREQILNWGNDRLGSLKDAGRGLETRRKDAVDASVGAVRNAEATVLETARDLLGKAGGALGDRAPFLKKGEEALNEALVSLRAGHHATLPIDGYDDLSVKKISKQLDGLGLTDLRTLKAYETAHKARKTMLAEYERRLADLAEVTEETEADAETTDTTPEA